MSGLEINLYFELRLWAETRLFSRGAVITPMGECVLVVHERRRRIWRRERRHLATTIRLIDARAYLIELEACGVISRLHELDWRQLLQLSTTADVHATDPS